MRGISTSSAIRAGPNASAIPWVRHIMEKRVQLQRPRNSAVEIKVHVRVRIVPVITHDPMPRALLQRVAVRTPALQLVADATVEIVVAPARSVAPEREAPLGKKIIDKLCDRPVHALHHR